MNKNKKNAMVTLLLGFVVLLSFVTVIGRGSIVEAEDFATLDFSDTEHTYTFLNVDKYGDLEENGWELTKENEHDYVLKLKNVHAKKIVLPIDDADKGRKLGAEFKPRETYVRVELYGDNIIRGNNSQEDGLVGQWVKGVTLSGPGNLTVDSTHGINIYTNFTVEENVGNILIKSKLTGLSVPDNLTIKGGNFVINAKRDAIITSNNLTVKNASITAEISDTDQSVISVYQKASFNHSTLTLKKGGNSLLGGEIVLQDTTLKDAGEKATGTTLYATGRYNYGNPDYSNGDITIQNSTVETTGGTELIDSERNVLISHSNITGVNTGRRESIIGAYQDVTINNGSVVNIEGNGFGIAAKRPTSVVTIGKDTDVKVYIVGRTVADVKDVDGYAFSSRKTVIENGAKVDAIGPNQVFSYRPTFEQGNYYISGGAFASKDEKFRYASPISKETYSTFHSSYRSLKLVYVADAGAPKFSGSDYQEGKVYCSMPTITVTDDNGVDTVTVNGKKIYDFIEDKTTKKTFRIPSSKVPAKEIVAKDIFGNESITRITAYNGCLSANNVSLATTKYSYDGKAKQPYITVKLGTKVLEKNEDYTVKYNNNVKVGTASVTVTGKSDYQGNVVKTFTIEKQDNTVTASNIKATYSNKAQNFVIKPKQKGNATFTYRSNNNNVTVDQAGKVTIKGGYIGSATITITAGANDSYNQASTTIVVSVEKANNTITASNVTKNAANKNQTFTIKPKQVGNGKLTYSSNNKSVTVNSSGKVTIKSKFIGSATITITANASSTYNKATKKITVVVNPAKMSVSKLSNGKGKKMTVKWSKNTNLTGYQIQYTTDKNFKNSVKTVTIKKNKTTSTTISKLTKNKKYYVRIRAYKTVSKKNYYSSWSSSKNIKITK